MNPDIFREYDIRGVVNQDLTDEVVRNIGMAYGSHMAGIGKKNIAVGGDCRISTESIRTVLIKGILSTGCNVTDIGVCTTPCLYFSLHTLPVDGGIMITGSHNPKEFNGFKICVGTESLYGKGITMLRDSISKGCFSQGVGVAKEYDIIHDYKRYMEENFSFDREFKVAIDAGNGTAGEIIVPILRNLGVEVIELNCTMDGNFPSHHPDPTVEKNLEELIQVMKDEAIEAGIKAKELMTVSDCHW